MSAAVLLSVSSAAAEVCDKVVPKWNPADGPVTVGQEIVWAVSSPLFLLLVVAAILSTALRIRALTIAVSLLLALLGLVVIVGTDNEVFDFAIREGCVTGYPVIGLTYLVVAFVVAVGLRIRRKQDV